MTARELVRAGKRVTILEARHRCGGRIYPLPTQEFGYPAEGGAEFVHGAAPVTRAVMREAGLSLLPRGGTRWSTRTGALLLGESSLPHAGWFYRALAEVKDDLPIAEFLETHFADRRYDELRRSITRTVEGYDAADPRRASTLALRDGWMARDDGKHGRIAKGYGELIEYLLSECRRHGAALHLGAAISAIDEARGRIAARCHRGVSFAADAAILTLLLPILSEIALPSAARERVAATADIGFGNVVKILFRFATKWWGNQSWRARSGRSVVPAFRRNGPDLVVPVSRRISGADGLVGGAQGRQDLVVATVASGRDSTADRAVGERHQVDAEQLRSPFDQRLLAVLGRRLGWVARL
jgi:Flavin containing amine oxidoreductase/NAD(P)-binding Rossmann-like domain